MKQVLLDGGKPFLPEDIIRNILKRLPVKYLIRSQCVCKPWKNLIKTPSFIADHIQYNTHQNPYLLFQGLDRGHPLGWCFLDHEMQVVKAQSEPLVGSLSGVRIISSINGLICFQSNNSSIFLWNPATREVRQVFEAVDISDRRSFCTGFGFSSIIGDYKVVGIHVSVFDRRVIIRSKEYSFSAHRVNQVQVYSLSTGSWREIEFGNLDAVYFMSHGFPANGAIFWLAFRLGEQDEDHGHLLVSFDIATEVFSLIRLPSSVRKSCSKRPAVYENKLAMLCCTTLENSKLSSFDLWVIEEGTGASGRWNWTKKHSTSAYPCLLYPGTIWRNKIACNKIACNFFSIRANRHEENNGEGKVVLFNIPTNEFKTFAIPKYGAVGGSLFNYVESLVSVGSNHIEEF